MHNNNIKHFYFWGIEPVRFLGQLGEQTLRYPKPSVHVAKTSGR